MNDKWKTILSLFLLVPCMFLWNLAPVHAEDSQEDEDPIVGFTAGNYDNLADNQIDASISNLKNKRTMIVSVVTTNASPIGSIEEASGKRMGIIPEANKKGTDFGLEQLNGVVDVETVEYGSYADAVTALYNGEVDMLLVSETDRGVIHDEGSSTFNSDTRILFQASYETDRDTTVSPSDDTVDMTSEPFVIFISGNDNYGGLDTTAKSDSNTVVAVNPITKKIVLVSIPRDYYEPVSCASDAGSGCPAGQNDKLTHSGMYGIHTTAQTIEDFLGVNINYTIRVNFSSLANLVDVLDGINVNVPEGMEVDTFYSNDHVEGVQAGINHLDGERALAFARERHAYEEGDLQRIKNQQMVLEALIKRLCEPATVFKYGEVVDAINDTFETDMSYEEMLSFVQFELAERPDWQFESYALTGSSTMANCASVSQEASVVMPDEASIQQAKDKLLANLEG